MSWKPLVGCLMATISVMLIAGSAVGVQEDNARGRVAPMAVGACCDPLSGQCVEENITELNGCVGGSRDGLGSV